ncbi:MAG: 50S ribosomal protein L13 [Candidatus Saccharimonadales bacterium]
MKTFSLKGGDVDHKWVVIDASSAPLGRVATVIATRLMGKYKPTYTPNIDDGDYVVVTNAAQVAVTGNKESDKVYYNYSGFPSGLKEQTLGTAREKNPERIIERAVAGMIPHNKLHAVRMKRLRVFAGADHTHEPQKPVEVKVKEAK